MITDDMVIPVGNIFKPHGYKGEMNVDILYGPELFDDPKTPFFVKIDNILVPFFVQSVGGGVSGTSFLKFKGVDSDAAALMFTRKELYTLKSALSGILGVSEADLALAVEGVKGFEVIDAESGQPVGRVEDVEEGVEYDYLVVFRPGSCSTVHIPFIDEFVDSIEETPSGASPGKIFMRLPEGLLEI